MQREAAMSLNTTTESIQSGRLLHAMGRLDSATAGALEKPLLDLFAEPGARVLLDFGALSYVSSAGLRVVLMAAKKAREVKGRLVLCGLQPHVAEVFEMSGFARILEIAADEAEGRQRIAA